MKRYYRDINNIAITSGFHTNWYNKFYEVNMALCHAASVVANYLSAVESDDSDDGSNEYSQFESEGASKYEVEDDVTHFCKRTYK